MTYSCNAANSRTSLLRPGSRRNRRAPGMNGCFNTRTRIHNVISQFMAKSTNTVGARTPPRGLSGQASLRALRNSRNKPLSASLASLFSTHEEYIASGLAASDATLAPSSSSSGKPSSQAMLRSSSDV
ncbi:hypothetical protein MRX96_025811 [Rhipicephalus microplus]